MLITECIICGTKIEKPRRGKRYCSNTCKNRAYFDRKKKAEESEEQAIPKEYKYTFDYAEYKKVKEAGFREGFLVYCFLRRHLSGEPNIKEIIEYLKEFSYDALDEESTDNSVINREFHKFLVMFYSGQVLIINVHTGEE